MRGGPVSRILSKGLPPLDDHSSKATVAHGPLAANPNLLGTKHPRRPRPSRGSYLALLPVGLALPPLLPAARWALTPPFHPHPRYTGAVSSLWRFPSDCSARALPGTVALWSPDFPRAKRPAAIQPSARRPAYAPAPAWSIPNSRVSASANATSRAQSAPQAVGLNLSLKLAKRTSGSASTG